MNDGLNLIFVGIKQIFRSPTADERQGFIAGLFSSGAWVLPVSAAAFAGRFRNEIQTLVQDVLSKYYFTYSSFQIIGIEYENPFSIIQYHFNLFSNNYIWCMQFLFTISATTTTTSTTTTTTVSTTTTTEMIVKVFSVDVSSLEMITPGTLHMRIQYSDRNHLHLKGTTSDCFSFLSWSRCLIFVITDWQEKLHEWCQNFRCTRMQKCLQLPRNQYFRKSV